MPDDIEGRLREALLREGDGLALTITPAELGRRLGSRRSRRRSTRFALLAAAIAVIAVGSVGALANGWLPVPTNNVAAQPSPDVVETPRPTEPTASAEASPSIPTIRGDMSGSTLLFDVRGGDCFVRGFPFIVLPDLAPADSEIDVLNGREGWVEWDADGRHHRFFHGGLEDAAIALGGTRLAISPRDTWILLATGVARELVEFKTPRGRSVWVLIGSVQRGKCGPDSEVPPETIEPVGRPDVPVDPTLVAVSRSNPTPEAKAALAMCVPDGDLDRIAGMARLPANEIHRFTLTNGNEAELKTSLLAWAIQLEGEVQVRGGILIDPLCVIRGDVFMYAPYGHVGEPFDPPTDFVGPFAALPPLAP